MTSETYIDDHFCPVCGKETKCEFYSAGHERDSSNDRITCTVCKSMNISMGDEWFTEDGRIVKED